MPYAAMEAILREASMKSVDVDVARALLRVLSLFPIGSYVALNDRSVARVLRRNGDNYSSPVVQVVIDGSGNSIDSNHGSAVIVTGEGGVAIAQALPTPGRNELSSAELLHPQPCLSPGTPRKECSPSANDERHIGRPCHAAIPKRVFAKP